LCRERMEPKMSQPAGFEPAQLSLVDGSKQVRVYPLNQLGQSCTGALPGSNISHVMTFY